jgi:hypothetical protein
VLLSQGHLVLAQLNCVVLSVLAQQLKELTRNHELVGSHSAHVGLILHAVDKAREGLAVETLHEALREARIVELGGHFLEDSGEVMKMGFPEGSVSVD